MGGGFPCAAFGGRRDVMEALAPLGPVYQAGTLAGNPVAVAAGIAALDLAREQDPYPGLVATAERLTDGLSVAFDEAGIPVRTDRVGSLLASSSPRARWSTSPTRRSPTTSATGASSTTCSMPGSTYHRPTTSCGRSARHGEARSNLGAASSFGR
jgi:glutamate-1-semialdehyde aminotransferase